MTTINLRDFYYWYTQDEFVEVTDEVAAEMITSKRDNASAERRVRYNTEYSLDAIDDTQTSALSHYSDSPDIPLKLKEQYCRLCCALNSLPEIQGRRVDAYYLLGKSLKEIANAENVSIEAVSKAIRKGLAAMKKYFYDLECGRVESCPVNLLHTERG